MKLFGKKIQTFKLSFAAALILLLTSHIIMGIVLTSMSKKSLRQQIEQRMLDIANTAAYQLNGDDLETFTADDIGSDKYNKALDILRAYQINIQLDYIYTIRDEGNDVFTFMIDPDPDSPGEFGKLIETTEALQHAAQGSADVDKEAYDDDWGRFYSAYSPIFDSQGNVAAIVGVDFNADWYDEQLSTSRSVVVVLTVVAVSMVIAVALLSHAMVLEDEKNKYRKKLEETLQREQVQEQELGSARHLAYTDPLTGVKSKNAYLEDVRRIDKGIEDGTLTEFGIIVFDLNGLKNINDTYGHEEGDNYIKEGCALICWKFCHSPVYRIGGDEFVVILEGSDYKERDILLSSFNEQIEENQSEGKVVVSTGIEDFELGFDKCFSTVFERADKKMYERKRYLKSMNK